MAALKRPAFTWIFKFLCICLQQKRKEFLPRSGHTLSRSKSPLPRMLPGLLQTPVSLLSVAPHAMYQPQVATPHCMDSEPSPLAWPGQWTVSPSRQGAPGRHRSCLIHLSIQEPRNSSKSGHLRQRDFALLPDFQEVEFGCWNVGNYCLWKH